MQGRGTLITGAAGFAGGHLLTLLAGTSQTPLLAWSRGPHPAERGVTWRQVDITDKAAVDRAIQDMAPARLVHLAGSSHVGLSWQNSLEPLRTNVLGTHHVLEAVRRHVPACRVLVVTSALVYQASSEPISEATPLAPSSPYGLSKLAQDQLALGAAHDDGLQVVVARPFNHIGPAQDPTFSVPSFAREIALIEAGAVPPVIHVGNLDAERDLTDVRDVAAAYAQLLERGTAGRAYNICSGTAHRIGDVLDRLIALARVPVTLAFDPERLRPSDLPRIVGDSTRLRTELGWSPKRSLDDTLRDTLDWWRASVASGHRAS
jgi:GDP-4-dehydro-6-deoxy-D-mannose reductase